MDKKNTLIGVVLIAFGLGIMFWQQKKITELEAAQPLAAGEPLAQTAPLPAQQMPLTAVRALVAPLEDVSEEFFTLENNQIKVTFTTRSGAIRDVALKQYPLVKGGLQPVIFNADNPTAALSLMLGADGQALRPWSGQFSVVEQTTSKILFRHITSEGIEILRGYALNEESEHLDPYALAHETRLINHSSETVDLKAFYITLGSMPPVAGDPTGEFLNCGYYNGKDAEFASVSDFEARSGFFGFGKRAARTNISVNEPLVWVSIKNQFFTSILTPQKGAAGVFVRPLRLPIEDVDIECITASLRFDLGELPPEADCTLNMSYYIGPKEYVRLQALGADQDLIMQFGLFGWVSKILLMLMHAIHKAIPNYGLTIILVTVIVKLLLWPLTAASTRSSRRMAKLQAPLQVIKERYKDNPVKVQQETMKLFKEYKVNPAMGCLPILIQIPIFLGLFWMLRSAAELRFAPFLWIGDLSMPDTVAHVMGFPINILPLIMGVTMVVQMRLSPMPTTDELQRKLFQFMPFVFLAISYSFPAGLVLYWTVQNLITILQQSLMRRENDEPLKVPEVIKKGSGKRGESGRLKGSNRQGTKR